MKTPLNITETRTSTVFTGNTVFNEFNRYVSDYYDHPSRVFVLVDENTRKHCLPVLLSNAPSLQYAAILEIKSGEDHKTHETALHLWNDLNRKNAGRHSLMVNLGGGVITDLGGFTAATFKRGMPFIHVPTTLMGMVDAAIGGKTAINLKKIKNQVGVFALPEAVYIYPGFLHSLDRSMVRSGMAEVLKYGLILDESLWKKLETVSVDELMLHSYKDPFWEEIILRSVRIKNKVVQEDFTEKGIRKILNFGHSFGHAFESLSMLEGTGYLLHGNAIAMGMICESYLSSLSCGLKENDRDRIINWILRNFEFYPVPPESFEKIMEILQQDKKRTGENLNFTLLSQPGKAITGQHCDQKMVLEAFSLYQKIRH